MRQGATMFSDDADDLRVRALGRLVGVLSWIATMWRIPLGNSDSWLREQFRLSLNDELGYPVYTQRQRPLLRFPHPVSNRLAKSTDDHSAAAKKRAAQIDELATNAPEAVRPVPGMP
jgi:hypothetical protein